MGVQPVAPVTTDNALSVPLTVYDTKTRMRKVFIIFRGRNENYLSDARYAGALIPRFVGFMVDEICGSEIGFFLLR